jgi:hypothetical protein
MLSQKDAALSALEAHLAEVKHLHETAARDGLRYLREAHIAKQVYDVTLAKHVAATTHRAHDQEHHHHREHVETHAHNDVHGGDTTHDVPVAAPAPVENPASLTELERYELEELRKKLRCSVCQDAVKDMMISKCCHMFCKDCLEKNLKARNRKCPTCKKMFGQDDLKSVWWT